MGYPKGGGGSTPGAVIVRKFPFAYDTPNILTGASLYTPSVGDVLLDAWVEIDTAWDGTTPQGDLMLPGSTATGGFWKSLAGQPLQMSINDVDTGSGTFLIGNQLSRLSDVAALAYPTSDFDGIYAVAGAAVNFIATPVASGNRYTPGKFTAASPVKFVVSQDGTDTGGDPGSTQGAAILYLVTATPA